MFWFFFLKCLLQRNRKNKKRKERQFGKGILISGMFRRRFAGSYRIRVFKLLLRLNLCCCFPGLRVLDSNFFLFDFCWNFLILLGIVFCFISIVVGVGFFVILWNSKERFYFFFFLVRVLRDRLDFSSFSIQRLLNIWGFLLGIGFKFYL